MLRSGTQKHAHCGLILTLMLFTMIPAAAAGPASVVLISVDTLRADHVGCYGYRKIRTPHLDELARGGTLFSNVSTPVPMTLPAHASLMTSTYPPVHGVEENGQKVGPGAVTLATVLQAHGYRTAAFIGGYVLDARFGLNQGFQLYDSPFHLSPHPGEDPPDVKRPAEAVLDSALRWLQTQSGHPFFAFVHLYDVHQPYTHGSYDGEIVYIDQAIGRFRLALATHRLIENTLIVLTSDHGESLGEHGEDTHGYFVYESTIRVPLMLHWPAGSASRPARIDVPVSLIDLAPALLEFLQIPAPSQFQGRSLLRLMAANPPGQELPIYAESMYARDHLGCSPLRSIRMGRYKLIEALKPELYDLASDPHESENRYQKEPPVAESLRRQLAALEQGGSRPPQAQVSPEVLNRLRSLGYIAGGQSRAGTGPDPKDRLEEYRTYGRAIRLANANRLPEAIREFQAVLNTDSQNVLAHFYIAVCYHRLGRLDDAMRSLNAASTSARPYPPAEELMGTLWLLKNDYTRARQQFAHLAAIAPANYGAHYNLGILAMREGDTDQAVRELQAACRADPSSAQPHSALGSLYARRGDRERAAAEFRQAIALNPADQPAQKFLREVHGPARP
jgi:arylsulfatase A-like enzyme/Flp pilus assembly protein TadD